MGPDQELEASAVIDTGFHGTLALPADMMSEFGQGYIEYMESRLADGSSVEHRVMVVEFYFQVTVIAVFANARLN